MRLRIGKTFGICKNIFLNEMLLLVQNCALIKDSSDASSYIKIP